MQPRRNSKPKLVIRNGAVNSVNCTSGGTIFVVNGSPSALDYKEMRAIASAASNSQSARCSPSPSPSSGKPTPSDIPQTMTALINIIDGAVNDLQNTTGGTIALINKRSQDAVDDEADVSGAFDIEEETS